MLLGWPKSSLGFFCQMVRTFWPTQCTSLSITEIPLIAEFSLFAQLSTSEGYSSSSKAPGRLWREASGAWGKRHPLAAENHPQEAGPCCRPVGSQHTLFKQKILPRLWLVCVLTTLAGLVASGVSDSWWPHRLQPARLLCPWDSPGKNTGVGCRASSRGSSWPRDWTQVSYVSCMAGGFFTTSAPWEAQDAA